MSDLCQHNICRKGQATEADEAELKKFAAYLSAKAEAEEFALKQRDAIRLASLDAYGYDMLSEVDA